MYITIVGSGYVGLVSGACFAELGHNVICVDKDEGKIAGLNKGKLPIFEPGLDRLIADNVRQGRLKFTTELSQAVAQSDAIFIAVGTPSQRGDGHADLRFVYAAAREIAQSLSDFSVIVTKSTVPVGTGDEVEEIIREANPQADFAVVSNPEFLKEGAAIDDFQRPDRIVVGSDDERALAVMRALYEPITRGGYPLVEMDRRGAELTKYAANAFLATKISFINEVANLCEQVGTDIANIARGIGLDSRIGDQFLKAGPGYGGSCFPKDTLALIKTAHDFGAPQQIVEAVVAANEQRKQTLGVRLVEALQPTQGKTVALLGLTFKANTDDMRDSPALVLIEALQQAGVRIHATDPQGLDHARAMVGDTILFEDPYQAIDGADAIVIATEWPEFRDLDLELIRSLMRGRLFADLRNLFTVEELDAAGFIHFGVGRPQRDSLAQNPPKKLRKVMVARTEDPFAQPILTPAGEKIDEAIDE